MPSFLLLFVLFSKCGCASVFFFLNFCFFFFFLTSSVDLFESSGQRHWLANAEKLKTYHSLFSAPFFFFRSGFGVLQQLVLMISYA